MGIEKSGSTRSRTARWRAGPCLLIACGSLWAGTARAQSPTVVASASVSQPVADRADPPAAPAASDAARRDSVRFANRVFRRSDLRTALGFAAVGAALLPLDTRITQAIRSTPGTGSTNKLLNVANHAAFPGAYVLGYAFYGAGLVTDNAPTARVGLYTATAVIVSSHITDALKGLVGRARPWASTASNEFRAGNGFSNAGWTSFPSGHATVAFAAATAFVDGSRSAWPHEPGFVAPLAYGVATSVAIARVYGQDHWASDVVAGAAVGTFTARYIVREGRKHPGNWLEQVAVHGALGLDERGRALFGWHSGPN